MAWIRLGSWAAIRTMIVSLQKGDLEASKRLRKVYNQEVEGMSRWACGALTDRQEITFSGTQGSISDYSPGGLVIIVRQTHPYFAVSYLHGHQEAYCHPKSHQFLVCMLFLWYTSEVNENSRSRTRVSFIFSRSTTRNDFLKSRSRLETWE